MIRCKVGDFAKVVRADRTPYVVGRTVKIVSLHLDEEDMRGLWLCEFRGAPVWMPDTRTTTATGTFLDSQLLPIDEPPASGEKWGHP